MHAFGLENRLEHLASIPDDAVRAEGCGGAPKTDQKSSFSIAITGFPL